MITKYHLSPCFLLMQCCAVILLHTDWEDGEQERRHESPIISIDEMEGELVIIETKLLREKTIFIDHLFLKFQPVYIFCNQCRGVRRWVGCCIFHG